MNDFPDRPFHEESGDEWIGDVQLLDFSHAPDGEGDGFLHAITGTIDGPTSAYRAMGVDANGHEVTRPEGAPEESEARGGDPILNPFDEEISTPPGKYRIHFQADGAVPPRHLDVVVRPGLGAVFVVYYYRRRHLEKELQEALATALQALEKAEGIRKLICSAEPR